MNNEDCLKTMLYKLTAIRDKLMEINEQSGASERARAMREEILKIGWLGVVKKYHPDINTEDPAAKELFTMYKFVYESMQNSLIIN